MSPADSGTLSVYLVLTPWVLMLDYAGPAEALRMACDMGASMRLHICAPEKTLTTSLGTGLTGLAPLPARLPRNSLVMVVGSSDEQRAFSSAAAQKVVRWLRETPLPDTRLASICSGALLLAQAGCLDGHRCTTHHTLLEELARCAPRASVLTDCIFVDDGRVLTSAGITAGIDLALHLIEQHAGAALAARVARRLVVYQRRSAQDAQISPWLDHRNHMHPAVHRAQDAIAAAPQKKWSLTALAQVACVSPRHLSRLFSLHAGLSVVAYQQQLRIERIRQLMLQHPQWSMERLAEAGGFASARDFRRVWRRYASV
jgi:transcriptional regulator GlxA family with amidase domain